jgi:hypothetical protein
MGAALGGGTGSFGKGETGKRCQDTFVVHQSLSLEESAAGFDF